MLLTITIVATWLLIITLAWKLDDRLRRIEFELRHVGSPMSLRRPADTAPAPVIAPFAATAGPPISEETMKHATAKFHEELRAAGKTASKEQIETHVRELLSL